MEDKKGNFLGYTDVGNLFSTDYKNLELLYFETIPSYKKYIYKYIGETLINFICGTMKNEDIKVLSVPVARDKALGFYYKSKFEKDPTSDCNNILSLQLQEENFEKLIAQNEAHTGSKIDYTF